MVLAAAILLATGWASPAARAQSVSVDKDVPYSSSGGEQTQLDVFSPSGEGPHPAIVVIHGGGFADGDKSTTTSIASYLAEEGDFVVFSINYRLAPKFRYPSQLEDTEAAVEFIREHAGEYSVDPARIGALGISVGGNLAALLGTIGKGPLDTGFRVAAVASWSGPMDLTGGVTREGNGGAMRRYFGFPVDQNPEAYQQGSPYFQVDPSDAPMYLFNSSAELVDVDQAETMAAKLEQEGVPHEIQIYEGGQHAEHYADRALPPTVRFFKQYLGGPGSPPPASVDRGGGDPGGISTTLLVGVGIGALAAMVAGAFVMGSRRSNARTGI